MFKKCTIVILLLSLTACVPMLIGGAGVGGYAVAKDKRSVKTIASDASITTKINALFLAEKDIKTLGVDVDTHDGIVTLYGKISSGAAEAKAMSLAQSVRGVRGVISKLAIK